MARKPSKVAVGKAEPAPTAPAAKPANPLMDLRQEIDRAFERALGEWPRLGGLFADWGRFRDMEPLFSGVWGGKLPHTDVKESKSGYTIAVELPGVDESDVEVTASDDVLTVKGEKKSERAEKDENYHMSERSYGRFERRFRLPDDVDAGKASAAFEKGVLTIALPRSAKTKAKVRKIAVTRKA